MKYFLNAQIHPVFPIMDCEKDAIEFAMSQLPIQDKNSMLAILKCYRNSLIQSMQSNPNPNLHTNR